MPKVFVNLGPAPLNAIRREVRATQQSGLQFGLCLSG